MEDLSFKIEKDDKTIVCNVIATYHDDNTHKDYMVYTDSTTDQDGKLNLYYSLYEEKDNSIKLIDTTDVEDKRIGLELIKELSNM